MRLLEKPAAVAQPTPLHIPTWSWSPSQEDQTQASPRTEFVQQRVWIPRTETPDDVDYPEDPSPDPTGMRQRLEKLGDKMNQVTMSPWSICLDTACQLHSQPYTHSKTMLVWVMD